MDVVVGKGGQNQENNLDRHSLILPSGIWTGDRGEVRAARWEQGKAGFDIAKEPVCDMDDLVREEELGVTV